MPTSGAAHSANRLLVGLVSATSCRGAAGRDTAPKSIKLLKLQKSQRTSIAGTDADRALLARKAQAVGRKALLELGTIVTPDTLLRWHRQLIARKFDFSHRGQPGRPAAIRVITELIVRMAL
jgi:hypothetical protein